MAWFHSGIESTESFEKKLDDIIAFAKTFNDRRFSSIKLNDRFRKDGEIPYKLELFMEYLFEEGLISKGNTGTENGISTQFYHLKLKGELFEGYVNRKNRLRLAQYLQLVEKIILSLGAAGAAVYGIWSIWVYYYHC